MRTHFRATSISVHTRAKTAMPARRLAPVVALAALLALAIALRPHGRIEQGLRDGEDGLHTVAIFPAGDPRLELLVRAGLDAPPAGAPRFE
jgi:hypothetical protein